MCGSMIQYDCINTFAKIIEYSSGDNIVAIEKERYARG